MKAPFLIGRLLFAGFFINSGISHLKNRKSMAGYARAKGVPVIPQDVVPIETGSIGLSFSTERCKRRRDKSAPCKSLQPICTFAPLLRLRRSYGLRMGTTC